jgi:ParB family chromosome partitioning protein
MPNEIITTLTEVSVDDIEMGERLRPVSRAGVEALKASFRDLGVIKDPIHIRQIKKTGALVLMAGGHRLTAARELRDEGLAQYGTMTVTAWRCSDSFAQLMEIDDNLAGADLSPLDTAVFLARRKEVYEALHPEAKAQVGAGLVAKRWDTADTMSVVSFAEAVSQQMGISDRHVRRLVRAGLTLGAKEVRDLRAAPRPVALADLMELSKITAVDERCDVVELMARGEAKGAKDAARRLRAARGEAPAEKSDRDAKLDRLADAWTRAGRLVQRSFLEAHGDEIRALLDDIKEGVDE